MSITDLPQDKIRPEGAYVRVEDIGDGYPSYVIERVNGDWTVSSVSFDRDEAISVREQLGALFGAVRVGEEG